MNNDCGVGTITKVMPFYPFGINHLKTGKAYFRKGSYKNYKYNGQELQETGMYDYGARLYMADIGRFGVLDPLLEDTDQPYSYAGNNPVNFVDYLGMLPLPPEDADGYEIGYIYTDSQGSWERVEGGWKSLSIEQTNLVDNIVLQAPGSSSPPAMPINCGACFYNGGGMEIKASPIQAYLGGPGANVNATAGNKPDRLEDASKTALAFMALDISVPEPTDAAVPKWVGYAAVGTLAGGYLLYKKMEKEIDGIEKRDLKPKGVLYQLEATRSGFYPNVRGGVTFLNAGDVWKYGETITSNRYSDSKLKAQGLTMNPIFYGNQTTIKVQEKIMIYGYFMINGELPPGNKIFR